jgi:tetratricopeptide (TPR) repeat protein
MSALEMIQAIDRIDLLELRRSPLALEQNAIDQLTAALRFRRIEEGITLMDHIADDLERVEVSTPNSGSLMVLVAQWVDAGFRDSRFLSTLVERFSVASRKAMKIDQYLQLRLAEGFRALAMRQSDEAIRILESVIQAREDLGEADKLALAHFWKGRSHRKKGEYDSALTHIVRARDLATASGDLMFRAIIRIQESWLLFQKGLGKEALQLLASSEDALESTDHYIALGNIESARGRIIRRSGDYASALKHFAKAERLYEKRDSQHANLARCLVNAAYVRRILALQIRKRIDKRAQSGLSRGSGAPRGGRAESESLRARYQRLCQEAAKNLRTARKIYQFHGDEDGLGNVVLNLGYLHLDRSEIDMATQEADTAFQIGSRRSDQILMARARILGAACENAHVDEQTGEHDDVAVHASRAREYSEEALALARSTQNRRLLAAALLARGATAANDFYQEWELARSCAADAGANIGPGENDMLVEALADLKSRIVRAAGINDTLRAWSEGLLGDKTFQKVAEEFAEIVIPKVWLREDKKIARVAKRLSISPKKVRRILRNAGWC